MAEIILIRHGETQWSRSHQHTSYTDLPLTAEGEQQAKDLARLLAGRRFVAVISSPRQRALRTAELAGLTVTAIDDDVAEWNYGEYEGVTTEEIRRTRPGWTVWTDGCSPGGESPEQIGTRIDRVIERVRPLLDQGDVAIVGHGHALRVLGARWIGMPPSGGGRLRLDTATLSALGYEREQQVILRWNQPPLI
ncbi:histidine phosphatase family protein [Planosporangium flavigriseum]|uniref:Phosphoglycerate mutase n=1 Tax=Planosporangium flavigriseum TaxID=373681 RepID=A0A8J3LVW1_9ACTN|nr:histidine phosphatase family protein [Planosporangium flavigriseum]NJC65621.1 histidine phosphatase family protein [Planosporangium flavigriseum]GIG74784.1 phosphoglycerate mutase [Planosporangium flavigriseum]